MAYKLRFLPRFRQDVDAAVDYILFTLQNRPAADALADELDRALDLVAKYPLSMPAHPVDGYFGPVYRSVNVKSYLAFYVVLDDTVEFRRFLHSAADLPRRLPH